MRRVRFASLMLFFLLFASLGAQSQPLIRVVVLPFSGGGLSDADLQSLTLSIEARFKELGSYEVIEQSQREKVLAYLDQTLLTCTDGACALRVARALSADLAFLATIVREGEGFKVNATLVDAKTGDILGAATVEPQPKSALQAAIPPLLSSLLEKRAALLASAAKAAADEEKLRQEKLRQESLQRLQSLRESLKASIAEIDRKRSVTRGWGWALAGVGGVSAGLSGLFWYLSDVAYQNYQATSDTALAQEYRSQVTMWDTLMLASAGTGVLCFGVSIPLFAVSPNSRADADRLKSVETEIEALEQAEGTKK